MWLEGINIEIQPKGVFIFLAIMLAIVLILNLLLSIAMPFLLIAEIIFAICEYFTIKKIININKQILYKEKIENNLLRNGYKKIYDNLFIDESREILNIYGKDYGFSQIVDCELVQNNITMHSKLGNSNNLSIETKHCNELYLNITVDSFEKPNIKLNVRGLGILNTDGERYKNVISKANEILSLFKLIISKNNANYVEDGTITKIEHKYTEEESNIQKLEELSKLHKNGVLTDYEYSIKKQELLEKIK